MYATLLDFVEGLPPPIVVLEAGLDVETLMRGCLPLLVI
jgi:hypothetical protein